MAIIKCNNGHFYDDVLYHGKCPHCKAESELLKEGKDIVEDDKTVAMSLDQINIHTNYSGEGTESSPSPDRAVDTGSIMGQLFDARLSEMTEDETDKTVSLFGGAKGVVPVTGWLVCISGKEAGKDYRLHAGKNFIGRSLTMDVPIVGDHTVARNKHCSVVYEPKDNTFYLSGESGNVVYLNDETVESFTELKADDVLKVGETELIMVPYCKEDRKWNKE